MQVKNYVWKPWGGMACHEGVVSVSKLTGFKNNRCPSLLLEVGIFVRYLEGALIFNSKLAHFSREHWFSSPHFPAFELLHGWVEQANQLPAKALKNSLHLDDHCPTLSERVDWVDYGGVAAVEWICPRSTIAGCCRGVDWFSWTLHSIAVCLNVEAVVVLLVELCEGPSIMYRLGHARGDVIAWLARVTLFLMKAVKFHVTDGVIEPFSFRTQTIKFYSPTVGYETRKI